MTPTYKHEYTVIATHSLDHQLPTGCQIHSTPAMWCRPCVCWEDLFDLLRGVSAALPLHSPILVPAVALWDASAALWAGKDAPNGSSPHTLPASRQGWSVQVSLSIMWASMIFTERGTVCVPAAGRGPHCLQWWGCLRPRPGQEEQGARSTERAHHCSQGPQYGGQSTPPCPQCSSLDGREETVDGSLVILHMYMYCMVCFHVFAFAVQCTVPFLATYDSLGNVIISLYV